MIIYSLIYGYSPDELINKLNQKNVERVREAVKKNKKVYNNVQPVGNPIICQNGDYLLLVKEETE